MNLAVVVQARMTSRRLPGEVLLPIGGKPMLGRLLDRLERCAGRPLLVVATSRGTEDDPIAEYCGHRGVRCHRGDLHHVASRFAEIAESHRLDAFVRVCGDSPLLDPSLVDRAVELLQRHDVDLVTNVSPRSFPPGQSVEALRTRAFLDAVPNMSEVEDREHVTRYFYRRPERYSILNFSADRSYEGIHLAVDTSEHLAVVRGIVARMTRPPEEYVLDSTAELHRVVTAELKEAA